MIPASFRRATISAANGLLSATPLAFAAGALYMAFFGGPELKSLVHPFIVCSVIGASIGVISSSRAARKAANELIAVQSKFIAQQAAHLDMARWVMLALVSRLGKARNGRDELLRLDLLAWTEGQDEHPDDYDGECRCKLCRGQEVKA